MIPLISHTSYSTYLLFYSTHFYSISTISYGLTPLYHEQRAPIVFIQSSSSFPPSNLYHPLSCISSSTPSNLPPYHCMHDNTTIQSNYLTITNSSKDYKGVNDNNSNVSGDAIYEYFKSLWCFQSYQTFIICPLICYHKDELYAGLVLALGHSIILKNKM